MVAAIEQVARDARSRVREIESPLDYRAGARATTATSATLASFTVTARRVPASSRYCVVTPLAVSVVTPPPAIPATTRPRSVPDEDHVEKLPRDAQVVTLDL